MPTATQKVSTGKLVAQQAAAKKTQPAAQSTTQVAPVEVIGSEVFNPALPIMVDISDDGNVYIDEELNNRHINEDSDADEAEIAGLAASIEASQGLLQPIVVYKTLPERRTEHGKDYELNSGFRRCRALLRIAESTGDLTYIKQVPATAREHAPLHQRKLTQLIENLQRKDLSPMETAASLKEALAGGIFTQKQLSEAIGWPMPTISNYLKATELCTEVQDMVHRGFQVNQAGRASNEAKGATLGWSHAREIAGLNLPKEQQIELAKIGSTKTIGEFKGYLEETYGKSDPKKDESPPAGDAQAEPDGSQRTPAASKRADVLKEKYIPYFKQRLEAADRKDKAIWEARVDAVAFVLNQEGTALAADIAPWEEELKKKAEAEEAQKEETRMRDKWTKQAVSFIHKKLAEMPPVDAPDRKMATLPEVLEMVKQDILRQLEKGKEAGQPEGTMAQGFRPGDVDTFVTEISAKYHHDVKEKAERKANAEAKKRKAEEEAKAAAENAKLTAEQGLAAGAAAPA